MQPRLLATAFALLCFAAATLAGAVAGNPAGTVLGRSLLVLLAAYLTGRVLETVAHAAVWSPPVAAEEEPADDEPAANDTAEASLASTSPSPLSSPLPLDASRRRAA